MRKVIVTGIIIVILLASTGFVWAKDKDIKFSLEHKEYYFKVGEEAYVPLNTESTYDSVIEGILSYSVASTINQGGIHFSTNSSKSTNLTVTRGENTVYLGFGTSDSPAVYDVNLKFTYKDKEDREVELKGIKIHFVSDPPKKNSSSSIEGKSQKSTGGSTGGGMSRSGGGMDPFGQMDEMEKQFNERFRRQQEEMDRMLRNRRRGAPSQKGGGSTENKMQDNQMPQDSSALKAQMEKQLEEQKKLKEEFQKNIAKNEDFQKKHQEMEKKGYKLNGENYAPSSKDSGSFNLNYKNDKGEKAEMKGNMEKGKMKSLESTTPEDKKKAMEALEKSPQFQKVQKQLKKEGFKREKSQVQKSGDKTEAQVEYKNDKGEKAKVKAEIKNDEVKKVEVEKEKKPGEKEPEKKSKLLLWIIISAALLSAAAYLIWLKYGKKTDAASEKEEETPEEIPLDYRERSKKMLENARKLYEEEKLKDAYAEAGKALRFFLTRDNGISREMTNDEIVKYLKKKGSSNGSVKECFDLCSLVEFARYQANEEDFEKIMETAGKIIKED